MRFDNKQEYYLVIAEVVNDWIAYEKKPGLKVTNANIHIRVLYFLSIHTKQYIFTIELRLFSHLYSIPESHKSFRFLHDFKIST